MSRNKKSVEQRQRSQEGKEMTKKVIIWAIIITILVMGLMYFTYM